MRCYQETLQTVTRCTSSSVAGAMLHYSGGDGSKLYTRADRRVQTVEALMGTVTFCNDQAGTGLNEFELDDIVAYLNESFYRFEFD